MSHWNNTDIDNQVLLKIQILIIMSHWNNTIIENQVPLEQHKYWKPGPTETTQNI